MIRSSEWNSPNQINFGNTDDAAAEADANADADDNNDDDGGRRNNISS